MTDDMKPNSKNNLQGRRRVPFLLFWAALSLIYGLLFITPEFADSPFVGFKILAVTVSKWAFLTFCASGLLCLLSVNRIVFAVTFPILVVLSGGVAFFQLSVGVGLSPGVVDLAMANGFSVWMTLFSWQLAAALVCSLLFSAAIVYVRWAYVSMDVMRLDCVALGVAIMLVPLGISQKIKESILSRMPYTVYHSLKTYMDMRRELSVVRTTYDDTPAVRHDNAPDVFVVIGESLRADHLPMNGYGRNTLPLMSRDTILVSYPNIVSDSYYTHACVPMIMTDNDSLRRDNAFTEQSFIPLFRKAGYETVWFANQDLSESFAVFAHEADTLVYCNNVMSVYNFSNYLDTDILPLYDSWHGGRRGDKPELAVFHTIGSHWWYKSHYPDAEGNFKPELDSHDVGSATHEQIINSYDNTILATDRFLAALVDRLRDRNAIMIYVSDHGENLGEHGEYLHVNGYEETRRPACMIWFSEEYARNFPDKADAIRRNRFVDGNTDRIFHTVIDAASLQTDAYTPSRSLFVAD